MNCFKLCSFQINFWVGTAVSAAPDQSQLINKVPTRFDVYIKGNRNDFFATRGADIAIFTNILTSVILTYFDNFKN
jgi:hypothetical protein